MKKLMFCSIFFFLTALTPLTESSNILAVFPHSGKSHFFMSQPLVYKLAERGHNVTIITPFVDENPPHNVTYISLQIPGDTVFFNSLDLKIVDQINKARTIASVVGLYQMGVENCRKGLSHPNFQEFFKKDNNFDLAIVEFFNNDCFSSLAHVYNVPLVGVFSSVMMPWHNGRFGNPDNPAYIPNHFLMNSSKMTFLERVYNFLVTYITKIVYYFVFDSQADAIVSEFVGPNIPPVREIVNKASLFLINIHFSLFQSRPLVPGIIELGGFHVKPASKGKIPANVQKILDESREGVVYFSLGSTVRCSTMPKEKLELFQNALAKLPQKVLWKWEEDEMPGKPENVILGKWFPQNEILSHPNVKLFITHAGLMGVEEAVYHGVPMLLIPLFGDQPVNAAACAEKEIGVIVDYITMNEEILLEGINSVLQNKSYAENSKKLAAIFLDRPLSIVDTAVYWTEYVLRYKGAPQLRSAAADLYWFQEAQLDIILFIYLLFVLFKKLLKIISSQLFRKSNNVKIKKS